MQEKILQEIQLLNRAFAKLIGDDEAAYSHSFSTEAIDKAAKQFQKLSIERGKWIDDNNISKVIRSAPYSGAGAFIRREFDFTNYFKRGRSYYYNRKALLALAKELKERNVHLERFMEYQADRVKFKESLANAATNNKGKKKAFTLSDDLRDIAKSQTKLPSANCISTDIDRLKEEFTRNNFGDYIDIYGGNPAMTKFVYHFEKYLEPGLKRRCKKWCDDFNYANHALELVNQDQASICM